MLRGSPLQFCDETLKLMNDIPQSESVPPGLAAVVPAFGHTKYNVFPDGKDLSYHNEAQELSNLVNHAEKETIEHPYPLIYLSSSGYAGMSKQALT